MNKGFINYEVDTSAELYPFHFGIKQCEPSELCGPMVRYMYIIHYIIKGHGRFCDERGKYELNPGDFFAIYPDDMVSYKADKDDPWFFCWVVFNGKKAEECYKKIGITHTSPCGKAGNTGFADSVKNCIEYASGNKISQMRLTGYLYEALSNLEENQNTSLSKSEYVNAAIQYMEYNCSDKILASDAAKFIGLEYSYFYRIFKKEAGITPERYLINARMEKAKNLIKKGCEFKEIPNMVGVENIYYFTKLFKQVTKMTPSEYRNSIKDEYLKK